MSGINYDIGKTICFVCVLFLCTPGTQASTLPPDPNNAALLYYQALLLWPEPDSYDVNFVVLDDIAKGAYPNESVKKYLRRPESRATIELLREATQIPRCYWGSLYPGGFGHSVLASSLQRFSRFMQVYAQNLATEGEFRSALEHCIGIQTFARHIGEETFLMFSVSRMVNGRAFTSIRHILGSMPPDVEILTWLK